MAPARTRTAKHAASDTSPEAAAGDEWDAGVLARTAPALATDHLNQLTDDEHLRVLSHLSITELGRLAQVCNHCKDLTNLRPLLGVACAGALVVLQD